MKQKTTKFENTINGICKSEIHDTEVRLHILIKQLAPKVSQHFGEGDTSSIKILLMLPSIHHQPGSMLPLNIKLDAVRKLVEDLISDEPNSIAVKKAHEDIIFHNGNVKRVQSQEFSRISEEKGWSIDWQSLDVQAQETDREGFIKRREEAQNLIEQTEVYRLALADQVLAYQRGKTTLETWAKLYWPEHIKLSVRNTPEELSEFLARLPNNKADRDFQHGLLLLPRSWGRNEEKVTRYFNGKEGHVVEYQPSEVEKTLGDAPDRALTALDERFAKIKSEAVADVIDILFHHWHTTKNQDTNAATINAAKICEYRNKTLSGENLELHWHALQDAFSFVLRETSSDLKARIFFSESQGESTQGPGAKYIYSPGFMLQYALKGQPLYFAPFLQKVWALDPVRENEAKRLARYLRGEWRMNTEKYLTTESGGARAARWHTWEFLLAEAGIDVEIHKKGKNPKRLIETMKRAVETLYQMGVIADGDFHIYHPSDRKTAENLPTRGALDVWLTLRVCLAPSAALREALLETDGKRRAGRARDAKALSTERAKKQLRGQREAKPKRSNS